MLQCASRPQQALCAILDGELYLARSTRSQDDPVASYLLREREVRCWVLSGLQ